MQLQTTTKRTLFLALAVLMIGCSRPPAAHADLEGYIARPEPLYKWELVQHPATGDAAAGAAQEFELKLTSQEWQGAAWTHHVFVFQPEKMEHPDIAGIYVPYGTGGAAPDQAIGQLVANATGATFVVLGDVPNQPLFDKSEDELIAYTFDKYLETGDETWPLLFPMTKSVVKAMDAVQEFAQKQWQQPITRFVIAGASKRGWTTWLTGAVDKRVAGIIPIVYNNLNLAAQMAHQLETWGKYSEMIEAYTRRNLQSQIATDRGKKLAGMVDPWSYRSQITMPKLLVIGTNDRYWPLDALNLYRKDLKGPTVVLYAPNAGHSLDNQQERLLGSVVGWFQLVADHRPMPVIQLSSEEGANHSRKFTLTTDAKPQAIRLWTAYSSTKDFRTAKWQSVPMRADGDNFTASPPAPAPEAEVAPQYAAAFAEVEVSGGLVPLDLSSDLVQWQLQK